MSDFKSTAELEDKADRLNDQISDIVNSLDSKKKDLISKLDDLLKRQDNLTAKQIDNAACGRTSTDRRREVIANVSFLEEYLNFLDILKQ